MSAAQQQDAVGTVIGGCCGFIKAIFLTGDLTWETIIHTVILSSIGAFVGLLISHFGKKLFRHWKL